MAYVFRKKGSPFWWAGWTDSLGVGQQESTKILATNGRGKTEAKGEAIDLERKARRQRRGLEPELGPDAAFEDRAWGWFAQLPKKYRSKGTAETYLRQRILPFLGKKPSRAIGREDVIATLNANEKDRKGRDSIGRDIILKAAEPGTLEKIRGYIHAIYEWMIEDLETFTGRNPAGGKRMRERTKAPKRLPRYIPVPELVGLLQALPEHRRLIFAFAVVSAVRKGELLPLTWEDVRLEERKVFITKSRDSDTTKTGRERFVVIPLWLEPVFRAERERAASKFVFPNEKGGRQRWDAKLSLVIRRAAKKAGLVTGFMHTCRRKGCRTKVEMPSAQPGRCPKCGYTWWIEGLPRKYQWKDLRSSFATLAAGESGDLRYVQQVLGHGSLNTTEVSYVHTLTAGIPAKTDALTTFRPLERAVSGLLAEATEPPINGRTGMETASQDHETN